MEATGHSRQRECQREALSGEQAAWEEQQRGWCAWSRVGGWAKEKKVGGKIKNDLKDKGDKTHSIQRSAWHFSVFVANDYCLMTVSSLGFKRRAWRGKEVIKKHRRSEAFPYSAIHQTLEVFLVARRCRNRTEPGSLYLRSFLPAS